MKRRQFLAAAVIGSPLAGVATQSARADDEPEELHFRLVSFSGAATIAGVQHRMLLSGSGTFAVGAGHGKHHRGEIEGSGAFNHFNNASPVPQTILGSGVWQATKFLSFTPFGHWGVVTAGILELMVDLIPDNGSRVPDVFMRIVCNAPPGGILTGQPEGFVLRIPGAPFGDFVPLNPTVGLTLITDRNEERKGKHD